MRNKKNFPRVSTRRNGDMVTADYGNTGWGVFKRRGGGCTKLERFLPKNQHTQRKLLNFENWVNGEVSKSAKI